MTPTPLRSASFAFGCAAAAAAGLAGVVASLPEGAPSASFGLTVITYALPEGAHLGSGAAQRLAADGPDKVADYTFRNFNGDDLRVVTRVAASAVSESVAEYGVPEQALIDLQAWYKAGIARANESAAQRETENVAAANAREHDCVTRANAREQQAVDRFNAREAALISEFNAREKEAVARANAKQVTGRITARDQAELDQKMREVEAQNRRASAELQGERAESKKRLEQSRVDNKAQLAQAREGSERTLSEDRQRSSPLLAAARAQSRQRLEQEAAALEPEREKRRLQLYAAAGLQLNGKKLSPDVGKIVARNAPRLSRASAALYELAKKKDYSLGEAVGAALAMVQTAVAYKVPPERTEGKDLLGLLPPPLTLSEGWGDCDTKTALLASLLSSWKAVKMVGVSIPEHYLMGVQHLPGKGDSFIEVDGLPYVLLEPAGPGALPPGRAGEHTLAYLKAGGKYGVERL